MCESNIDKRKKNKLDFRNVPGRDPIQQGFIFIWAELGEILPFYNRLSHETWQLVNILKCLLPSFFKLLDSKEINNKHYMAVLL